MEIEGNLAWLGTVVISTNVDPQDPDFGLGAEHTWIMRDGPDAFQVEFFQPNLLDCKDKPPVTAFTDGFFGPVEQGDLTITPGGVSLPPGAGPPGFVGGFSAVGAGNDYSCGLISDGSPFCWGSNGLGQLGNGTQVSSSTPVPVSGDHTFVDLTVGDTHACGRTIDGTAYCWGLNISGELGAGLPTGGFGNLSTVPVAVSSGKQFNTIDAGLRGTCGVATDGVTYCWGNNFALFIGTGRLGDGSTVDNSNIPVPVTNSSSLGFQTVTTGFVGACALTGAGSLFCWGGDAGQFGNGDASNPGSSTPVAAGSGMSFGDISAGAAYMCGLDSSGSASCWSSTFLGNVAGQYGDGSTAISASPVSVVGGLSFAQLDTNDNNSVLGFTCGITTAGDAYCWGNNTTGQLGAPSSDTCSFNGNFDCSTSPLAVAGSIEFVDIAVGIEHTCGVAVDGAAYCWGSNSDGQLGDGTTNDSSVPVAVQIP